MFLQKKMLAVLGGLLLTLFVSAAAQAKNVWKAADDIYMYTSGHGMNSMFVVTSEGVVVMDSANSHHAKGMVKAIKKVTSQPVRYVLQSHNHWDHAGGGKVFQDLGATVIAHEEAYAWMKGNPHHDLSLPDEAWSGMRKDLVVGDKTIELHYLGMSHGMGMTTFLLPKQKVAYVADIATPNRVMFTIVPDFNITEWVRALKVVEKLDFDIAGFSHSHAKTPVGSKKDVTLTREYIEDLQGAISAEFKKGTAFEAIPGKIKLEKYKHWAGYKDWLQMNALRVMMDMYMGPYPWRPKFDYEP
jgi:glyoxylase-like metal-dependent hydrolase (beta-lactamase superfamily II)